MKDGWYRLPTIDPSLYGGELESIGENDIDDDDHNEDIKGNIRLVNGLETFAL